MKESVGKQLRYFCLVNPALEAIFGEFPPTR
jgi:hypothetical protein